MEIVRKVTAAETGGWGVAVVEAQPDEGGGTHIHRGESEAFFILEGRVELLGAESTTPLEPGSFVLVPPDTEHGLRVLGDSPARWLAVWPSALDGFPDELERAKAEGASPATLAQIRRRHGVEVGSRARGDAPVERVSDEAPRSDRADPDSGDGPGERRRGTQRA